MKTLFVAACFSLLAIGLIFPSTEAVLLTVDQLQTLFKIFGPMYIEFRKISDKATQDKEAALEKLWRIVEDNNWQEDKDTQFSLATLDPAGFGLPEDDNYWFDASKFIFGVDGVKRNLKEPVPKSLFGDPATPKDKLEVERKTELDRIQLCVQADFKKHYNKEQSKVACHYELFIGEDLDNRNPKARKDFMLIMIAFAKN